MNTGIQDHPAHMSLKDRAKLRLNEQRRLEHAVKVLEDLINKHMGGLDQAHSLHEVARLAILLEHLVKNQHIKDSDYARFKRREMEIPSGGF